MLKLNLKIEHPTTIIIKPGSLRELSKILASIDPYKAVITTDENIEKLWSQKVVEALENVEINYHKIILPSGESCKRLEVAMEMWKILLNLGFTRDSILIGLGGGTILDITGFIASTYMRGCHLLFIPTTLLAQVDAAIGGKNSINFEGKNIIGTFYHPEYVIIDPITLQTLPNTTFKQGLSEIVKHSIIQGEESFKYIEKNITKILSRDIEVLSRVIKQSVEVKVKIISLDYIERDKRILLNFGHTIAHSLERALNYEINHGEAVSIGLFVESKLAELIVDFPRESVERVKSLLVNLGLPIKPPMPLRELINYMRYDKKFIRGRPRLPLPKRIGEFEVVSLEWEELEECLLKLKI